MAIKTITLSKIEREWLVNILTKNTHQNAITLDLAQRLGNIKHSLNESIKINSRAMAQVSIVLDNTTKLLRHSAEEYERRIQNKLSQKHGVNYDEYLKKTNSLIKITDTIYDKLED